jgi:UDP-N-acetylglucosamine 4,6-dehydratase/5-epimerase
VAPSEQLRGKVVLVTGATGSFGTRFVSRLLEEHEPAAIRLYSRDELKQYDSARRFDNDERLRFLLGDVRDLPRLRQATRGVDVIVHAAALKQVPACEYNPFEAIQTNITGAQNIVTAAIENDVPLTLALSTDKAVNPVNLYGATKLCAEKIFTQGNAYAADSSARFANVRYGNVVGSRGSVVPLFKRQALQGYVTITDERMTRFWVTLDEAVDLVVDALGRMGGGETFVPRIPSMRIMDMAEALAPGAERRIVGVRPGEKLHEVLITEDESHHSFATDTGFVILPEYATWPLREVEGGRRLPEGFRYSSDNNDRWLTIDELREMTADIKARRREDAPEGPPIDDAPAGPPLSELPAS